MSPKPRADLVHAVGDLDALMSVRQVCQFFGGVSKMSLYRWAKDPSSGFPTPFHVGQKRYWVRGDILAFRDLKKHQARGTVTKPDGPPAPTAVGPGVPDGPALDPRRQRRGNHV
jgi:predicted DNA-binding transcriptional regulator AlpA